jgi:hypothetical protein
MQPVSYIAQPILNARDAIASHIRWKITLLTAARMRESLSARATTSIERPEECSIRRWLTSEHTSAMRGQPEYAAVLAQHSQFHRRMQAIATLLNSGEYQEAERQLREPNGDFERSSLSFANSLMAFERAHRQRLAS